MKNLTRLMLVFSITCCYLTLGCGGSGSTPDSAGKTAAELNQTNSKEELKKRLEEISSTGVAGSALAGMRESIESFNETDYSTYSEIIPLFEQLESAKSESQIKSIAGKMAAKL